MCWGSTRRRLITIQDVLTTRRTTCLTALYEAADAFLEAEDELP